jgi:lipopolysaccharide transport system ATP-binding protein
VTMDNVVINIENLSKQYEIGSAKDRGRTFREAITDKALGPLRRIRNTFATGVSDIEDEVRSIWALKDISLQVKQGEVIGVIGRNGAGKTTLLKVLSKITEPTEGRVEIFGRVGSLLEVGAGFHSELTGRENIYLNGSILGMKKVEIDRQFDEIVAFAEIEKFIDTPVKRYSSGMYMRLAFAVAANLEPEILLVDEVLAVGDAVFQTKCLAKMSSITKQGRTVLFVSHNLGAVGSICDRGIVIDHGSILFQGPVQKAIQFYEGEIYQKKHIQKSIAERTDRSGTGDVKLKSFHIEDEAGNRIEKILNGNTVKLIFGYHTSNNQEAKNVDLNLIVAKETGENILQIGTRFTGQQFEILPPIGYIICEVRNLPLVPGRYKLEIFLEAESDIADRFTTLTYLDVVDGDFYGSGYQVYENESKFLIDGTFSYQDLH